MRGDITSDNGAPLATATYATPMAGDEETNLEGVQFMQQHTFAFYGDAHICAELHFSELLPKGRAPHKFDDELQALNASGNYVANSYDDAQVASIFYRLMRDYAAAATYYQRALGLLPPAKTPQSLAYSRFVNDQLAMSYGMVGDLARSRAVNEAAIAKDPDYPIYYYNLACADAEAGDPVAAKQHLQAAFARRANTLRGERMPDPTQDGSLQKLKDNPDFWAFVQSLSNHHPLAQFSLCHNRVLGYSGLILPRRHHAASAPRNLAPRRARTAGLRPADQGHWRHGRRHDGLHPALRPRSCRLLRLSASGASSPRLACQAPCRCCILVYPLGFIIVACILAFGEWKVVPAPTASPYLPPVYPPPTAACLPAATPGLALLANPGGASLLT